MAHKVWHHHGQMSEAFRTVMFLSASGGLQDAYTYIGRGKVFANAQTGNIVLMSQAAFNGDLSRVLHYLIPLLSFALGVAAAEVIHIRYREAKHLHWRQLVLVVEILLLFWRRVHPQHAGSGRQRTGVLRLRHAGAGFPQGTRLPVRQHHVHRQHAQRHGIVGGLLPPARPKGAAQGAALLWRDSVACRRGRAGQAVAVFGNRTIWFRCALLLVSLCFMFIQDEEEALKEKA